MGELSLIDAFGRLMEPRSERVVRWIAWLTTHHRTTLRITEGITP